MTSPSGLERPVIPIGLADRPLSRTVRPGRPTDAATDADAGRRVDVSLIVIWILAGSIGWATLIGVGWFAVEALSRLMP